MSILNVYRDEVKLQRSVIKLLSLLEKLHPNIIKRAQLSIKKINEYADKYGADK
jgi:hypothetical protein